ncbi:unnamed protein product [Aphanomyces euteiches]|uniref:EndoU domain-containing protein n=1 Tax=Aphanomyces euteiches TaxID=100861 RepID=A0A6G0XBB7_9STRA|nr:hypothetical protein Ae201684_006577 [Aphanomyces euteiches]KAH9091200.1 hypothetical protein Ae201684P_006600 [Aphanomyces euteiches]KAH9155624.1 hypothetical protein AeRB84_002431 [Aphanomyces euteiches]
MAQVLPTPSELRSLSDACNRLWDLDENRLEPGEHYQINLQRGKKPYEQGDMAPDNLFTSVNPEVFKKKTFQLFIALLDNYERGIGVAETVTKEELKENQEFIDAIAQTKVIKYAHAWLEKNGKFHGDIHAFKRKMHEIWFGLYRREVANDSSGFEHVFIGEVKDGQVSGFHNWIQMYMEEKAGRLDYLGYIKPKQRGRSTLEPDEHEQVITIQFAWEKETKPVSSSLIGVSPEFEMALYTMCFLNGEEANEVQLGPYRVIIKCFAIGRGDRAKIGTSFPEACPLTEDQAATKIQARFRGLKTRTNAPTPVSTTPQPPRPAGNPWGQQPAAAAPAPPRDASNPWGQQAPAAPASRPAGNPWGTQDLQDALPKKQQH